MDRRDFLKIAGVSAAGLGAKPALDLLLGAPSAEAKTERPPIVKGKHWAMVVDMRKLTEEDVHAAVTACHTVHNVPLVRGADGKPDAKREIKWLWADHFEHVFPDEASEYRARNLMDREFLVLCNHCTNPPCVRVCPTQATYKREDGIVMMDMHRCIGCRFCMAGCPYGSRSFNYYDPRLFLGTNPPNPAYPTRSKGVVEKCCFCVERLEEGLAPACVEACHSGALAFGDLASPSSKVRQLIAEAPSIRRKLSLGTGPNVYYII